MNNSTLPIDLPITELKPALLGLSKIINKRPNQPILGAIKIERTSNGWITLTASDLSRSATVRLEQPSVMQPTSFVIPFDDLNAITKSATRGDILTLTCVDDERASIQFPIGGQMVDRFCRSFPIAEFPETPSFLGDSMPIPEPLRRAIQEAFQCASRDESRAILNGVFVDVTDPQCQCVVSTDGHHLFSSNSFSLPLAKSIIIPTHRFLEWKEFNADGEWQLKVCATPENEASPFIQISSRRWQYTSEQITGTYPNWKKVTPASSSYHTTIQFPDDLTGLLQTINRMPGNDEENSPIGMEMIEGKFALLYRPSKQQQQPEDDIVVEIGDVTTKGSDLQICLNRNFLIKALEFGLRTAECIDETSPIRFSAGGKQMIVMPTRLSPRPAKAIDPADAASAAASSAAAATTPEPAPVSVAEPAPVPAPPEPALPPTSPPPVPLVRNITPPLAPVMDEPYPLPGGETEAPIENQSTVSQSQNVTPDHQCVDRLMAKNSPPIASGLELAIAQTEVIRSELRGCLAGLHKLAEVLKQAQREGKASDKEIASVRQTLRSLQSVRI